MRHGVPDITAVEVDPAIISFGRRYHPQHPYDSDVVHVVNDDARSFFSRTKEKFDVIAFGLLDSHTTTAQTNARLDHYVYTREGIALARGCCGRAASWCLTSCLKDLFIPDRLASVLRDVFKQDPIVFGIPRGDYFTSLVLVASNLDVARQQIGRNSELQNWITRFQRSDPFSMSYTTRLATDDWPYLPGETAHPCLVLSSSRLDDPGCLA